MDIKEYTAECQEKLCTCCLKIKNIESFGFSENWRRNQCNQCRRFRVKPKIKLPKKRKQMIFTVDGKDYKDCPKCKVRKETFNFSKCSKESDGFEWQCKQCKHETHYLKNKGKNFQRERKRRQTKEYKENRSLKSKERYRTDVNYKLKCNLSGRILNIFRRQSRNKDNKTVELLGCSIKQVKEYISSKFKDSMTWQKFLDGEVEIDHVIPCEIFNLQCPRQQKVCFHYTNLQPMWGHINHSKQDRLDDGRLARNLTPQEKLEYLKSKGFDFISEPLLYLERNILHGAAS